MATKKRLSKYPDAFPEKVLGIIEIKSQTYVLIKWHSFGKAYCPYNFVRENWPKLLSDYYKPTATVRLYRNAQDLIDLEKRRQEAREKAKAKAEAEAAEAEADTLARANGKR